MRHKFYECDLYKANILFVTNCSGEKFKNFINKRFDSNPITDDDISGIGFTCLLSDGTFVTWVEDSKDVGVLFHELIHLALDVLNKCGVVLDNDAEPLTYYCQFLYNKLVKIK